MGTDDRDFPSELQPTADGGFLLVGSTGILLDSDGIVLKLDSNGQLLWQATYGGSDQDILWDIEETASFVSSVANY